MPIINNAMQIKAGAKADHRRMGSLSRPVQFLLEQDKDADWAAQNMDWLETQGMSQIKLNSKNFRKNYNLANGIIDKADYIPSDDNEVDELMQILVDDEDSAFELKFFPLIPTLLDLLSSEFAKRNDKIVYRSTDDISHNEMLDEKLKMIEAVVLQDAEAKMQKVIEEMGLNLEDEEQAQQAQEMMSPENLKTLPEIENFFRKDYRNIVESWATHQHNVDEERFHIRELEVEAFRDSLIVDREFWHFEMGEDDYNVQLWNPTLTFYHKSPQAKYISQGNYVGMIERMTVSDAIDNFGYMMTKEQLESLESLHDTMSFGYILPGMQNDGSFYDGTKSHKWNTEGDSLGMRQFNSYRDFTGGNSNVDIEAVLNGTDSDDSFDHTQLLTVTRAYWKSQRMIGHLVQIDQQGMLNHMIVDETFQVVDKPVYDTSVMKGKNKDNLVFGQHIEWIWINHVWGGIKLRTTGPTYYNGQNSSNIEPMYLNVKPLKFQFKGDLSLYGCKLPVEGCVYSERNSRSTSLVDRSKSYQLGFNMVNNQISDILIDELGSVVVIDQNSLPKHSMGEDWGDHNFSKAFVAMKNFQMLPVDTSITNTENGLSAPHYNVLNLEQTQRLSSRVQLANHFKNEFFESVGVTPQRKGAISSQETATGVEQAINMSYAQTEMYFTQHCEYLMPRVHSMRTNLAQYYQSTNPSIRLQHMTSLDERLNFEMNGTELLAKDVNVYVSTKVNHRSIIEQIKSLALTNNTGGASVYDLGNIMKAESLADVDNVLKAIEEKTNKAHQEQMQAEQEAIETAEQNENARLEAEIKYNTNRDALNRERDVKVAQIRSAGYAAMNDRDGNDVNDYVDTLEYLDKREERENRQSLDREKELNRKIEIQTASELKRQELQVKRDIAQKQLDIAKTNKNKWDVSPKERAKENKKAKKK